MWRWLTRYQAPKHPDGQLQVARVRVDELEKRAEKVVPELVARRDRNHWGQTIAAIAHHWEHS